MRNLHPFSPVPLQSCFFSNPDCVPDTLTVVNLHTGVIRPLCGTLILVKFCHSVLNMF